jgi:hypothetical protein
MNIVIYIIEGESEVDCFLIGQSMLPNFYLSSFVIYATLVGVWSYECVHDVFMLHNTSQGH